MTRINTKTYCDLSGCEHSIVGPTRGNGWTIWMGKDLCPEHDVSEMPDVYPEDWANSVMLYDTPNHVRNVDGNQIVFRKIHWCTTHDSNGMGPDPHVKTACHYSGLFQATLNYRIDPCVYVEKLIEV